jgi:hypothetical protein
MIKRTVCAIGIGFSLLTAGGAPSAPSVAREEPRRARDDAPRVEAILDDWLGRSGLASFEHQGKHYERRYAVASAEMIPEGSALLSLLNARGVLVQRPDGTFVPSQIARADGYEHRTSSGSRMVLIDPTKGVVFAYSRDRRLYGNITGSMVVDLGASFHITGLSVVLFVNWLKDAGATRDEITREVTEALSMGIGVFDRKGELAKGYRQTVQVYDTSGNMAGSLYVTACGPNIAQAQGQFYVQTPQGLRPLRQIDADGSWRALYAAALDSDSFRAYQGVLAGGIANPGLRFNENGELELYPLP